MDEEIVKKHCSTCRKGQLMPAETKLQREVAGHVFSATLPAMRCEGCGAELSAVEDLARFDLAIAGTLLEAGGSTGEVFRFARKAISVRAVELARLLRVSPETISRWETGVHPPDPIALAMLALLVRDASAGSSATRDTLAARTEAKPLGKRVALRLSV